MKRPAEKSVHLRRWQPIGWWRSPAETSSPANWLALAQTFDARPAAVAELASRREEVPVAPVADAFVSALRRLCWPSFMRLPERHRLAVSACGQAKLSLARLALEEARTRAWRELDTKPLAALVRWLARLPFKLEENLDASNLAFRAYAYLALCENAIKPGLATGRQRKVVRQMIDFGRDLPAQPDNQLAGEALMAIALCCAKCFERTKASEALALAAKALETAGGEGRALLGLVRAWVDGEYQLASETAEALINAASCELDAAADPWLSLFLDHEGARLAVNHSLDQRRDNSDLLKKSAEHGKNENDRLSGCCCTTSKYPKPPPTRCSGPAATSKRRPSSFTNSLPTS